EHFYLVNSRSRMESGPRAAFFPSGGVGQEEGGENGLRSRRHGDSNSWRVRGLQGISVRRLLSRSADAAATLRAGRRIGSGGGGAILGGICRADGLNRLNGLNEPRT